MTQTLIPPSTSTRVAAEVRKLSRGDLIAALLAILAAIAVTADAWFDIFRMGWTDEELSYVLLAPAVVGWLIWVRRREFSDCRARGAWVGLPIIALACVVFCHGYWADPVLWRAGAVMLAVGAVGSTLGSDFLLRFSPALLAAVFLVPIDPFGRYHIAAPLQNATAATTQWVCDLIGINVDRMGASLTINGVEVAVAEGCNGMRMVLTLFMACYAVAFARPLRWPMRAILIIGSPIIAIIANVLRLVPTVWVFGHGSVTAAETFHTVTGWIMIVLSFLLLMGILRVLNWMGLSVEAEAQVPSARPEPLLNGIANRPRARWLIRTCAFAMLLALGAYRVTAMHPDMHVEEYQANIRAAAAKIPTQFGGWIGRDMPVADRANKILRPDVMVSRHCLNVETGATADVLLVHCADAHNMAGHFPLRCYPAEGWILRRSASREWMVGTRRIPGTEYEFSMDLPGKTRTIIVANCIFLPGGKIVRDMNEMAHALVGVGGQASGAGQMQVCFEDNMPLEQRDRAVATLMENYQGVIEAILADVK